jgi:hypothetical protein
MGVTNHGGKEPNDSYYLTPVEPLLKMVKQHER